MFLAAGHFALDHRQVKVVYCQKASSSLSKSLLGQGQGHDTQGNEGSRGSVFFCHVPKWNKPSFLQREGREKIITILVSGSFSFLWLLR